MAACLCSRPRNRVLPEPDNPNIIEIRPNRHLHIIRLGSAAAQDGRQRTDDVTPNPPKVNPNNGLMQDVGVFPDGQTALFFIHGVGGSSEVWRPQYQYFSNIGFDVIVPDLIGHGLSDAPLKKSCYHFSEIAMDLLAIFDRFHRSRNVVIGHSYGSSFATLVTKEREALVTKLVLISSGGPTALGPQAGVFQLPVCMLSCLKPMLVKRLLKKAFHKSHDREENRLLAFKIPTYVLRYTMRGQDWLEGDEEFHETLMVPTLLIYGTNDNLVSIEEEMQMKNCVNGSKLVLIDEASHMVTLEKPDIVNRFIQQFLALKEWRFTPRTEIEVENGSAEVRERPGPFRVVTRC